MIMTQDDKNKNIEKNYHHNLRLYGGVYCYDYRHDVV